MIILLVDVELEIDMSIVKLLPIFCRNAPPHCKAHSPIGRGRSSSGSHLDCLYTPAMPGCISLAWLGLAFVIHPNYFGLWLGYAAANPLPLAVGGV